MEPNLLRGPRVAPFVDSREQRLQRSKDTISLEGVVVRRKNAVYFIRSCIVLAVGVAVDGLCHATQSELRLAFVATAF